MKIFRLLSLLSCLFATYAAALAAILPSFRPQESAWLATDIVVVTEGEKIDGVVQVIETLKGNLKPGATLTLPELAEFNAKEARLIDKENWLNPQTDQFVTGKRMILFLRDQTKIPVEEEEDSGFIEPEPKRWRWSGAHPMAREIKYSSAWIEEEKVYALFQLMNPGPSSVCSTSLKEVSLRETISDVISDQTAFNAAAAIVDPSDRAKALRPFIHSSMYLVQQTAFIKLTECGSAALPVLHAELESGLNQGDLAHVVEALAKAGGRDAGPTLTKFLARELVFWKLIAPTLDSRWWNGAGFGGQQMDAINAAQPIRDRWTTLLHTVYALRALRYTESAYLVAELSELWRSLPQMNADQVGQACDDYFRTVGRKAIGTKRLRLPRYKIYFRGNKVFSSEELTRKMAEYMAQYDELEKDYEGDIGSGIFAYALRQLSAFPGSRGYIDAQFSTSRYTTDQGEIISVQIDEGKQYRMCELKIEGAKRIAAEQIRATFPLRTGDIVNEALIDKWVSELERSYFRLGYLESYVEISHKPPSNTASDILGKFKVEITEQEQSTVKSIKFDGQSKYSEAQLARALSLRSGVRFTVARLESSIKKLNERFDLELDWERDVEIVENNRTASVTLVIYLNRDRPPKDSFGRWMHKREWSL